MVTEKVTKVLQEAVKALERERDEIDQKIASMQETLNALGEKRGPGRPKGPAKRGPGRPKGSKNKRGPGRPPKKAGTKKKVTRVWTKEAKQAAADRMREYWRKRKAEKK